MDDQPDKIERNWKHNPQNCDSHVKFVEEVLSENQQDQSVTHQIVEVVLVEKDEKLNPQQDDCHEEDNFQWPAFLPFWRRGGEYLTGPGPHSIVSASVSCIVGRIAIRSCQIFSWISDSFRVSDLRKVEGLGEDPVVVYVWKQIGLELLFVGRIGLVFEFF